MSNKDASNEQDRYVIDCSIKYATPRTCSNFELWPPRDLDFVDNSLIPEFVFTSSKFKRSFPTEPGVYLFAYGAGESFLGHTTSLPPHDSLGPCDSRKGAYLKAIYNQCETHDYLFEKFRDGKSWQIHKKSQVTRNKDGDKTVIKPHDYWCVYFTFVWLNESDFQDPNASKSSLHRKLLSTKEELETRKKTLGPRYVSCDPHTRFQSYFERLLEMNDPHLLISRALVKDEIKIQADALALRWDLEELDAKQKILDRCISIITKNTNRNS
jgi:hypothetical protein